MPLHVCLESEPDSDDDEDGNVKDPDELYDAHADALLVPSRPVQVLPVADASLRAAAAAPLSAAAFLAMGLVAAVVAFRRRMAGGVAGKHPTEATPLIVKR